MGSCCSPSQSYGCVLFRSIRDGSPSLTFSPYLQMQESFRTLSPVVLYSLITLSVYVFQLDMSHIRHIAISRSALHATSQVS